ncbi:MAG: peroxide stress protein YaaA [Candidimonas sp.]|nr:MAG: peroxide stress protein YaaA [Burkholderiales bacterium 21-58-4]TAL90774.1 MAG: peroxide stress protein YaaA [Candidimonas sp.]TAM20727.1 MAG: peroxide stress protein YaaA [Candidimonas sp.]TAM74822.1 MAG: peroxide stress protein YaaA [Candidimonas sp.]
MLLVLSPAKKLDVDSTVRTTLHSQPIFVEQAAGLIKVLKKKSVTQVAALMGLSDKLAQLNVERYAHWQPHFTQANSRQAALMFNGDVYGGLDAPTLTDKQLDWAQDHVAILSGLYGVLRPLDLMQPYRLEMGTRLATKQGETLYDYWGSSIAQYLNARMAEQGETVLLNLASEEYFKSVDRKALTVDVVQCVFQDYKNGAWKVISFHAKRARGLMARYVIEKRIKKPGALQAFASEGYGYAAEVSAPNKLVFRRQA